MAKAVDSAQGLRDQIAEMLYSPVQPRPQLLISGWQDPLSVVTDSRDAYDRLQSDAGQGTVTQKNINLALGTIKEMLQKPKTVVRWTDGTNMLSGILTKAVEHSLLREALSSGKWSIEFRQELVTQARVSSRRVWEQRMKAIAEANASMM